MKLIKLTDDHYVVVTDEPIEWRDYFLNTIQKEVYCHDIENYDVNKHYLKKITHSTQPMPHGLVREGQVTGITAISLQEVKELIGEVDVDKRIYDTDFRGDVNSYKQGYNQALEDNKEKKYTEAQLIWAIQEAYGHGQDDEFDGVNKIEESIKAITKHIQAKTEWEVEWETIDNRELCNCSCHNNPNMIHFVACCNDGWIGKVTQKLKLK